LEIGRAIRLSEKDENSYMHVGCGVPCAGQKVLIVEPQTRRVLKAGSVGEIWVAGEHIALGYWNRPEESKKTFQNMLDGDCYLRTGDLGFQDENGEIFITGRLKDLIIIRGRNYYPQDLEFVCAGSSPILKNAVGAAFSVQHLGIEKLVLLQEVPFGTSNEALNELRKACTQAVMNEFAVEVHELIFLEQGGVPRTSSGKIRRSTARDQFQKNTLRRLENATFQNPTLAKWKKKLDRRKIEFYVLFKISSRRALSVFPLVSRGS